MCAVLCSVVSVVSDSVHPFGLQPSRLLCPWNSPGKNTGGGCHALLQGIFPTQGLNPCLLHQPALTSGFFTASTSWEAQVLHGVGQNVCSGFSIISCRKTRTNFLASPILLHIYRKLRAPCYLIVSGLDLWTQISHEVPKSSY